MYSIVAALLLAGIPAQTESGIEVRIPHHSAVYELPRDLHILTVTDSTVSIAATEADIARLRGLGYAPRITIPDYQAWVDSVLLLYRSYAQVCSTLTALAQAYPSICRLETIGFSVSNRAMPAMRITDNPLIEEPEPEFRVLGPHHGDEKIASEIALSFLQYLLASYDTSMTVKALVDAVELWVIPIVNPDGHVANDRYNSNGVDLNRDFGYGWAGDGGSTRPFSQPETRAVREHALANNIAIEFAFHSTASYVNYLWDDHPADPPDSGLIVALGVQYADSTYGSSTTRLDTINGYRWYEVDGSCQDAGFGLHGIISYTIETRQPSPQPKIDSICVANRRALLGMVQAACWGISGTVRDSFTGVPLFARISVTSPERWDIYTDPMLGDYHRPLLGGTYTIAAHSQGYRSKVVSDVTVPQRGAVNVDFELVPDTAGVVPVQEMTWQRHADPNHVMPTTSIYCLGAPDGRFFSLGVRGDVCLDAGRASLVRNLPGDDITVFDGDAVPDGYWLYAANDWNGPWHNCGRGNGTTSFDLGRTSLDSARYLRIACDSTGSPSDPKAGPDLDAVTYAVPRTGASDPSFLSLRSSLFPAVWPNPATRTLHFALPPAGRTLEIVDIAGRSVECYPFAGGLSPNGDCPQTAQTIDATGLAPGVYLARVTTATGTSQRKFIVAPGHDRNRGDCP